MDKANGFDLGTSPHGLSADLAVSHQETDDTLSLHPCAKPLLKLGEFPASGSGGAVAPPQAAQQLPQAVHRFELTEMEFLNAYFAVEHDRNRTRNAIRKGKAVPEDMQGTDSLWQKLNTVMFARLKGGQA
jgi:hypothetical protein